MMDLSNKRIIISRTDSIGDVMLTLPICAWLKENYPSCTLIFIGRNYTLPVLNCFSSIDEVFTLESLDDLPVPARIALLKSLKCDIFIHVFPNKELAKLAKKAGIPVRIGTSHRSFHLLNCNYRVNFTRKKADEHEAQLNFHLLKPLGCNTLPPLEDVLHLMRFFKAPIIQTKILEAFQLNTGLPKVILHPRSQGSALEWSIDDYAALALRLAKKGWLVYFSGTEQEGASFRGKIPSHPHVFDLTGKMNLTSFIAFINHVDALVACSTGPLHIAAVLNKHAVGLFSNQRPIHPGRWRPIGENVSVLSDEREIKLEKNQKELLHIAIDEVENVLQQKTALSKAL